MADKENTFQAPKMSATQQQIEDLNLATAQLNFEIAQAELIAKKEALVNLKFQNEDATAKRERIMAKQRNASESDRRLKEDSERKKAYCNHSQGGEGYEGMFQGEAVHTTFQKETALTGHEFYRCIRCEKEVSKRLNPEEYARISKLPRKGLKGSVPILFKFIDGAGNIVNVDEAGHRI